MATSWAAVARSNPSQTPSQPAVAAAPVTSPAPPAAAPQVTPVVPEVATAAVPPAAAPPAPLVPPAQAAPAAPLVPRTVADASTSLHIGNLAAAATKEDLEAMLKHFCPTVRVMKAKQQHQDISHAVAIFPSREMADDARKKLYGQPFKGLPLRVMFREIDAKKLNSPGSNLFIRGLPPSIDERTLFATFQQFGDVKSVRLVGQPSEKTKTRSAFVSYVAEDDAKKATASVNKRFLEENEVTVALYRSAADRARNFTNLYFKFLRPDVTEADVRAVLEESGQLVSLLTTNRNCETGTYGYVSYQDHDAAVAAIEKLNGKPHPAIGTEGKAIFIERFKPAKERSQEKELRREENIKKRAHTVNVYVKNLGAAVTDDDLRAVFGEYGPLYSCRVMRDENGESKKFGFACFEDSGSAGRAIEFLNNSTDGRLGNGRLPLYVGYAMLKPQFEAMKLQQHLAKQYQGMGGVPMAMGLPMGMGMGMPPMTMEQMQYFYQQQQQQHGQFPGYYPLPGMMPGHGYPQQHQPGYGYPHQGQPAQHQQQMEQQQHQQQQQQSQINYGMTLYNLVLVNLPNHRQLIPPNCGTDVEVAKRVTGMMLELEEADILACLNSTDAFRKRLEEGLKLMADAAAVQEQPQMQAS